MHFSTRSIISSILFHTGMLLRKMTEDMIDLRDEVLQPAERKAFLFSAHEVNIAALARALGTDDPIVPAYGSTIILETLQDDENRYYVRVSFPYHSLSNHTIFFSYSLHFFSYLCNQYFFPSRKLDRNGPRAHLHDVE